MVQLRDAHEKTCDDDASGAARARKTDADIQCSSINLAPLYGFRDAQEDA